MFEWLKNLLFDEEDVVVEEDKLEEIDFSKVNDFENILSDAPKKINIEEKSVKEKREEVLIEEEKKNEIPLRTEFNIQLKESQPKKEVQGELKLKRTERSVSERKEKDVEINSVISPMFGGNEEKKIERLTPSSPIMKKKDGLGTVISPMYGQAELSVHEQEAIAKINENKQKEMPIIEEDDWKDDIPLEELISSEEESNDCVQFSLFGDSQSINE